jgi:hypothetical protein
MAGKILDINGKLPKKTPAKPEVLEPTVTTEVEQWGILISWLRKKDYTPAMVRATIVLVEEKENAKSDT